MLLPLGLGQLSLQLADSSVLRLNNLSKTNSALVNFCLYEAHKLLPETLSIKSAINARPV